MPLPGFTEGDTNLLAAAYFFLKTKETKEVDWEKVRELLGSASVGSVQKRMSNAMKKQPGAVEESKEAPAGGVDKKATNKVKPTTPKKVNTPRKKKPPVKTDGDDEIAEGNE